MKGAQEGVTRREGEGGEIRGGAKKAVTFAITEVQHGCHLLLLFVRNPRNF